MENENELQQLRELGEEIAGASTSPWQPRVVAQAFRSTGQPADGEPFVFTMQAWINLEAVRSPFLHADLPAGEEIIAALRDAFEAFGHDETTPEALSPAETILIARKIITVIVEGFAMRLPMQPPRKGSGVGADGFGDWLPIFACLKTQLFYTHAEALLIPVGQAFAVMSAHRHNEGWIVGGEPYEIRGEAKEVANE